MGRGRTLTRPQPAGALRPGLSQSSEEVAICLLFTQVGPSSGLLTETVLALLSPLYQQVMPFPALSAATKALALNHLACSSTNPLYRPQAISALVGALKMINTALQDPLVLASSQLTEYLLLSILSLSLLQVSRFEYSCYTLYSFLHLDNRA